jgi:hypothetical protein
MQYATSALGRTAEVANRISTNKKLKNKLKIYDPQKMKMKIRKHRIRI